MWITKRNWKKDITKGNKRVDSFLGSSSRRRAITVRSFETISFDRRRLPRLIVMASLTRWLFMRDDVVVRRVCQCCHVCLFLFWIGCHARPDSPRPIQSPFSNGNLTVRETIKTRIGYRVTADVRISWGNIYWPKELLSLGLCEYGGFSHLWNIFYQFFHSSLPTNKSTGLAARLGNKRLGIIKAASLVFNSLLKTGGTKGS